MSNENTIGTGENAAGREASELSAALATTRPVSMAEVETLIAAARKIRHWHDCMYNTTTQQTEGMVVSAAAVRELWKALEPFGG